MRQGLTDAATRSLAESLGGKITLTLTFEKPVVSYTGTLSSVRPAGTNGKDDKGEILLTGVRGAMKGEVRVAPGMVSEWS